MVSGIEAPSRLRRIAIARQVLARLAFYPFLAVSLLVFPAALPWMILCWLALVGAQWARGKPAWMTLASCLGVILVKRVDWLPGLIVLGLGMTAATGWDWMHRPPSRSFRASHRTAALIVLVITWAWMAWSWEAALHTSRRPVLQPERPIVCLGDSLSAHGFANVLRDRLRVPVLDHSRGGITAAEALEFYPEVLASKPQAVILELGGHDYLKGRSRKETRATLARLVQLAREAGAEVFLFEVPRGFISDPFAGLERELARELDLEVIPDGTVRNLVLFSPFTPLGKWTGRVLSDDGLHPNARGHAFIADRVEAALRRVYGDSILK